MLKKINKCIFPAAGFGTRFLPATKSMPKEMLPVINKPLIHFAAEEAMQAKMLDLGIVYGRYKKAIPDYFDSHLELELAIKNSPKERYLKDLNHLINQTTVSYIRQSSALGLGHAILTAKPVVGNEAFGVVLADDLCFNLEGDQQGVLAQMEKIYQEHGPACVIAVEDVPKEHVSRYGIVEGNLINDQVMQVTNMVEKPKQEDAKSTLAVIGRYILTPEVFTILERLFAEQQKNNDKAELQITTALNELAHKGHKVLAYRFQGKRFDCGNIEGMLEATDFVYKNNLYIE